MSIGFLLAAVTVGAFAQSATGLGVAVVAGPFLLQAHGYQQGLFETTALCLITSAICGAYAPGSADRGAVAVLGATLAPGVLLGFLLTQLLDADLLMVAFGALLAALGLLLLWRDAVAGAASPRAPPGRALLPIAGLFAGGGAYLFAMPGPMAAWGLARIELSPAGVRATLALYFVLAYGAVLTALVVINGPPQTATLWNAAMMAPGCVAGAGIGLAGASVLPQRAVRVALAILVLFSGLSILVPR